MFIYQNGGLPIKVWVDQQEYYADSGLTQQTEALARHPFAFKHVSLTPDGHLGKGMPIGGVLAMKGAVCPNAVGVDIGCVDKDTEYLSEEGWVKISEYKGEKIAEYNAEDNSTVFRTPINYVVLPETKFYYLKTKYGINQMLSGEHTVLLEKGVHHRKGMIGKKYTMKMEELYNYHQNRVLGMRDYFINEIPNLIINTSIPLTDEKIRIQVMVMADGCLDTKSSCVCRFRKSRKIKRAEELLSDSEIKYTKGISKNGDVWFRFKPPLMEKRIGVFKNASVEQLKIIEDEIMHWDFDTTQNSFCSKYKEDVDFVQYVFATQGKRTSINYDNRSDKETYRCLLSKGKPRVQLGGTPKTDIKIVDSEDGLKYCFTTSTGFWIMRRGGCICVTGNCGMMAVKTDYKASSFSKEDLIEIIHLIKEKIPVGCNHQQTNRHRKEASNLFNNYITSCFEKKLTINPDINIEAIYSQLGTLGGGNHFGEFQSDIEDNLWIMLHSGSRNIGLKIANRHAVKAKEICKKYKTPLPNDDLAILLTDSQEGLEYLNDMEFAIQFSFMNRMLMLADIKAVLVKYTGNDSFICTSKDIDDPNSTVFINIHHNFAALENHFGENVFVHRKGATRVRPNIVGIIPGSMSSSSYIVRGKDTEELKKSFSSCSHGAGRTMSRTKAKENLSIDKFRKDMGNIASVDIDFSHLDESGDAYKNIQNVMSNQSELVEIIHELKPIMNFKG